MFSFVVKSCLHVAYVVTLQLPCVRHLTKRLYVNELAEQYYTDGGIEKEIPDDKLHNMNIL